jgi:hypothetical protein
MASKKRICYPRSVMEVTATTLYEAIALGLVTLRDNNWVLGIPDGFAPVKVRVTDVPVEHEVKMKILSSESNEEGTHRKT